MKYKLISLLIVGIIVSNCGNDSSISTNSTNKTPLIDHHSSHEHDNLQLNKGKKWKVNAAMKPLITESEILIKDYHSNSYTDFSTLAKQLSNNNNELISRCTMKGQAHDELHKWLMPHIKLVQRLEQTKSTKKANLIIQELRVSFATFNTYFN